MKRRNILKSIAAMPAALLFPSVFRQKSPGEEKSAFLLETSVAGFQYYSGAEVLGRLKAGSLLHLKREPNNPYDYDAIEVFWGRDKLGYIPRSDNSVVAQLLDRGMELRPRIGSVAREAGSADRVGVSIEMVV